MKAGRRLYVLNHFGLLRYGGRFDTGVDRDHGVYGDCLRLLLRIQALGRIYEYRGMITAGFRRQEYGCAARW
jgi:hypothetical protein